MPKRKKPATADKAAYMRARRQAAADSGLCSKCTARRPAPDHAQCKVCLARGAAGMKRWRVKQRVRRLLHGE